MSLSLSTTAKQQASDALSYHLHRTIVLSIEANSCCGTVLKWDTLCIQIVSQLCSHDATICIQAFDKCVRLTYALLQSTTNVHLHIATEK